ncbi:MAG: sel1 repeat family protein [Erysipelotrichales bacterium]|nr:sel1 repeat family protein [Erysipelotrichales bacterium]
MTDKRVKECLALLNELASKTSLSEEEEFIMQENLRNLFDLTGDPNYITWVGGIYYGKKKYDLALKYYEQGEALGDDWVSIGLGYIWYYGRTGKVDYEKAFHYFSKTLELKETGIKEKDEDIRRMKQQASYKIADMYKNGYYVKKDYGKYVSMIEDLYDRVGNEWYGPRSDIAVRLAGIRKEQGKTDEALELYYTAREDLCEYLRHDRFFGNLNRMNWLVNDIYELTEFDETEFDLYDLFYLLKDEHTVTFEYREETHEIESRKTEEGMIIRFDEKWYKDIQDFFAKANLEEDSLEYCYPYIENMEVNA